MRIAVLDDYQKVARGFADWASLEGRAEIDFLHDYIPPDERARRLEPYEILCLMRERTPLDAELIAALPRLKLVVTSGMKNASIDVAAARARGIVVSGTKSGGHATAELALALILMLARGLPQETGSMRAGGWQVGIGRDLNGATLGIVGLGRLGARIAAMAQACGMRTVAWSRNLDPEAARRQGVEPVAREALFREADFVTIHTRLSERTRHLVGEAELALMKRDACLVNTSRGPIVDTVALVAALEAGRIAGAALDVYDVEPLPADDPLRKVPNLILTPHIGYVTRESYEIFYGQMVECVAAFLDGAPVRVIEP